MAEKNYKEKLVGVFGHPVAENPTVVMFEAAFRHDGLNYRYLTIEVRPEDLAAAVRGAIAMGFGGFNLTIPHKVEILKLLDRVSPEAEVIGAVNTVAIDGGRLLGRNTDGQGFMTALRREVDPKGKRCVVLGAGGAARAITVELALAGAESLLVLNRDPSRGEALAALLCERTPMKARFARWSEKARMPEGTEILVNATSIGLYPKVEEKPDLDYDSIDPGAIVCDVIPNPPHSSFLREAERRGAKTLDGLGMLVYQGAIAYTLWTGREPPLAVMRDALAKEFGAA
jgi:shikimate dehydrogenase